MATLYTRPGSPYWWIYHRAANTTERQSTGIRHEGRTKPCAAAERIRRSIEEKLANQRFGLSQPVSPIGLDAYRDEYLAGLSGIRPATRRKYEADFSAFLNWAEEGGVNTMADVTRSVVGRYLADARREGASDTTLKWRCVVLARGWEEAMRRNYCRFEENPWAVKVRLQSRPRAPFSDEEMKQLMCMEAPRWVHTAMRVCAATGQRIGAVQLLRWENIDLDQGTIYFAQSKKQDCTAPMPRQLSHYLRLLRKESGLVFPELEGKNPSYASTAFGVLTLAKLGWRGNWHRFRHTYITNLHRNAVPKDVAMRLADHSTEAAHRLYDHTKIVELRQYVEGLELYPEREPPACLALSSCEPL